MVGAVAWGAELGPVFKAVSADQAQAGNLPIHVLDADANTRWAAQGRGRWIQCEFKAARELSALGIGFHRGERDYAFAIQLSVDGRSWDAPRKFQSGAKGEGIVEYRFAKTTARFVRVTVQGSNVNDWANIHSLRVPGVKPVPVTGPGGVQVTTWSSAPETKGGVGITVDDRGRVYVVRTTRRKQSSLDIRGHQDWVKDDLSFAHIEDRRRFYKAGFKGLFARGWQPADRNGDGMRDWRDLMVQKDAAYQLADTDGDGKADQVKTLGEYHTEVTGIAAGVLAVGADVYVAVEPDVIRYRDTDGDGFPEKPQVISTGYSLHIGQGGHNLSGLAVGPDGRVYWSLADKGHSLTTAEGRKIHGPNRGGIFRSELDGSNVERFSSGERNAQELAFDAHGNLFSMDNDGDYPGEKERALYITEGSEHGWRLNWQWLRKQDFTRISGLPAYNPWMAERMFLPHHESFPAYLTPTIGNFGPGPCGFTANPGTALGKAYAGRFFMTNNQNQVRVFQFLPAGASFRFEEETPIKGGLANTGLAIGPDGALYAASYANGVYRFDVPEAERHPLRDETQTILASEVAKQSIATLAKWMEHADQRVRMKGQFELTRRGVDGMEGLVDRLQNGTALGKLHAVWGIGMVARRDPQWLIGLSAAWKDADPEVRAQAAKTTGELGTRSKLFERELLAGLTHKHPRVRFFSAIALGNRKAAAAAGPLVKFIERDGNDPYQRHAGIMGLAGAMTPAQLAGLHTHADRNVRLAAIVALRRLESPAVRAFLADQDELVLLEVARAIHDDLSIPEALPDLAGVLRRSELKNEALMRRAINAAFRVGTSETLQLLTKYLEQQPASAALRRTALASVLWWSRPPVLCAVEGRFRKHAPRDAAPVHAAVRQLRPVIARDPELLEVLLNGATQQGHAAWLEGLEDGFADWPAKVQSRFLEALGRTGHPQLRVYVVHGLASADAKVRAAARAQAAKAGVPVVGLLMALIEDAKAPGRGAAVRQLAVSKEPGAAGEFGRLVTAYRANKLDAALRLDVWEAAKGLGETLPETVDRFAHGGDAVRGRALVMNHAAAQCIRCHQIGKVGSNLGPPLDLIGKQDAAYLVRSLLEPAKEIADGYGTVALTTKGGQQHAGFLAKQTPELWTLRLPDGKMIEVPTIAIKAHTLTTTMPPMGAILKPTEIRDVVRYLKTLK